MNGKLEISKPIDVLDIRRGDVFVVRSRGLLPGLIRLAEVIWSKDHKAEYNHAGIVLDYRTMTTLEALWRVKEGTLWKYAGKQICIYRPIRTLEDEFDESQPIYPADYERAIGEIEKEHKGQLYPIHRLILHIFRPAAKLSYKGKFVVCSELVAKYLWKLNARGKHFAGTNPDDLADEWYHWKNMKKIFVGKFPEKTDIADSVDSRFIR